MTTEVTPPVTTPAAPPAGPTAEQITTAATKSAVDAAVKIAEESATRIAGEKLSAIGRALTGESAPDPGKTFLEKFVSDPARTLRTVVDVAKSEIKDEANVASGIQNTQRSVVGPMINEYPELNSPNKLALVEKLAGDYQATGMSYADALKKGCEDTVKEFKLKSVSEAQRDGTYRATGLPGGGGFSPGAPKHDEAKSQSTFLQMQRERANSFRVKRTISAK